MALPALAEPDARLTIVRQRESADGRGVQVDYLERDPGGADVAHFAQCRFRAPGRPLRSSELVDVEIDGVHLSEVKRYFLIRFWLATPEARAADPAPLGDIASLPILPPEAAYLLQQAINGLPLTAVYALLAAAYSLVYGLVGRINLAFGELAAAGGYAAALGAGLFAGGAPALLLSPCADVRRLRRRDLGNGGEPLGVSAAAPSHRPDRAGRVDRARAVPARVPSPDAGLSPASG